MWKLQLARGTRRRTQDKFHLCLNCVKTAWTCRSSASGAGLREWVRAGTGARSMWRGDGLFREVGHCLDDIHIIVGHGGLPNDSGSRGICDLQSRDDEVRREALDNGRTRPPRVVVEDEEMLGRMSRKEGGGGVISVVILYDRVAEGGRCRGGGVVRTLDMRYENIVRRTGGCGGCRGSHGDRMFSFLNGARARAKAVVETEDAGTEDVEPNVNEDDVGDIGWIVVERRAETRGDGSGFGARARHTTCDPDPFPHALRALDLGRRMAPPHRRLLSSLLNAKRPCLLYAHTRLQCPTTGLVPSALKIISHISLLNVAKVQRSRSFDAPMARFTYCVTSQT